MSRRHLLMKAVLGLVIVGLSDFSGLTKQSDAQQRHPRDYRGVDARTFNPGRSNAVSGGHFDSGYPVYGQAGLVQQFGSSATYSNGRFQSGVVRTNSGVLHIGSGMFVPAIVPQFGVGVNPYFSAYPYGNFGASPFLPPFAGNVGQLPPVTIDPLTGQLVPFFPWCGGGLPYFGGINPYYPGSVLAPTILNLNLSMRPSVPSTAAYNLTDPRMLDFFPPQQMDVEVPFGNPVPQDFPMNPPPPLPAPDAPLLNEFEAFPAIDQESSLPARIHSLRHQSTGDEAFRNEDYDLAKQSYRRAMELAPDRRTLWLRIAFTELALGDFPEAARCLKTALTLPADATRAWTTAEELYGSKVAERARTHGVKLWDWLSERPMSSDRLLLAGAFQKFRGYHESANELLDMARHEGRESDYVDALAAIAGNDIGQRAIAQELGEIVREAKTIPASGTAPNQPSASIDADSADKSEGIFIPRRNGAPSELEEKTAAPLQSPELVIPRL